MTTITVRDENTSYSTDEDKLEQLADYESEDVSLWSEWDKITGVETFHAHLTCDHENTYLDTTEVDTMRNGEHDTYEITIKLCADCDKELAYEPDCWWED